MTVFDTGPSDDRDRLVASALLEVTAGNDDGMVEAADALIRWSMRLLDVGGAGLMMADDRGVLRAVMVSSDAVRVLEAAELRVGRGPCVEAHRTATAVIHADTDVVDARWPQFGPSARAGGMRAVHAIPVLDGGTSIGVLNLFRAAPGGLAKADVELACALTGAVDPGRLQQSSARSSVRADEVAVAFADAAVIEQAKGILAVRLRVTVETASAALRHVARERNRTMGDLAVDVVAGTAHIDLPLTGAQMPSDTGETD